MCLFRKNKNIAPKLNIETKEIVIKQKLKRKGVRFETELIVPRNFVFASIKNGRTLDIVEAGKHSISAKLLKETVLKLGLLNQKKKLKFAPVEAYFVNLNDFDNIQWQISKIELEDKKYGAYKISASGKYSLKIVDARKFLNTLNSECLELTNEIAMLTIKNKVEKTLFNIIYNKNYEAEKLYFKNSEIINDIFNALKINLKEIGIHLLGITLGNVEFSNKILKSLEKLETPPKNSQGTSKSAFENWQANNPIQTKKGHQFVTIEPEEKGKKNFFKESMAPYFFIDLDDEKIEERQEKASKSKWLGPIEKEMEEKSKQFVNLDDEN